MTISFVSAVSVFADAAGVAGGWSGWLVRAWPSSTGTATRWPSAQAASNKVAPNR